MPIGPVIGPMVISGYMIEESKVKELIRLGVKDSKLLSPHTREIIAKKIKSIAKDFVIITVSAEEIDKLRTQTNLNKIEIKKIQQIINLLNPDKVIIDSPEVNVNKFESKIRAEINQKNVKIICENFADKKYPIVGAASILAKVVRDRIIENIKKQYKIDFGTGYSSDERTIKFLKKWIQNHKDFPKFVRKSWITAKLLIKNRKEEKEQKMIKDFVKDSQELD